MTIYRWFSRSAAVYDLMSETILDYDYEARAVLGIVRSRSRNVESLVEFGCGTGQFLYRFAEQIGDVVGCDISHEMLDVLRSKYRDLTVVEGDLAEVDLGRTFDAAVCLSASIAYTATIERLHTAMRNIARHVAPGGVVIVDGWVRPRDVVDGYIESRHFEGEGLLVDRSAVSHVEGGVCIVDMGHMITSASGVETFVERHELGAFSDDDLIAAFEAAGLNDIEVTDTRLARARCVGSKPG